MADVVRFHFYNQRRQKKAAFGHFCPWIGLFAAPDDECFKFAWPKLRELNADIVDEHCYTKPDWFLANTHRYDH
jgi:hypothetical protein